LDAQGKLVGKIPNLSIKRNVCSPTFAAKKFFARVAARHQPTQRALSNFWLPVHVLIYPPKHFVCVAAGCFIRDNFRSLKSEGSREKLLYRMYPYVGVQGFCTGLRKT
jgi:hypothetical protein